MVRREIEIDEETDRILTELAAAHNGGLSSALADLVQAHQGLEYHVEFTEAAQQSTLRNLLDKAESDFLEGRIVTWKDLKAHNGL